MSELLRADEIILDTPMYNHAIPAVLKAWIDRVVRAGKTFRYTSAGTPEGLLASKNIKAVVIIASGGKYTGDPGWPLWTSRRRIYVSSSVLWA